MRSVFFSVTLGMTFGLAALLAAPAVMADDDAAADNAAAPAAAEDTAAPAADDAALDEDFTDALSLDEADQPQEIDLTIFEVPENASPEELFAWVESLETKVPQPRSREEMEQMITALTAALNTVAEQVLAHPEATVDHKMQAYQMRVQALLGNAQGDPSAIEKVTELADKILADEKEETLQLLGLELKAQTFLARMQQDPSAVEALRVFLDPIIDSPDTAQAVKEKAQEIKAVSLLISAEEDSAKTEDFENYFSELLAGPLSPESRERLYQLRIQSLMPEQDDSPEKAEAKAKKLDELTDKLLNEQSDTLKALGYAAKANSLVAAAQKDPAAVDALFDYANKTLEVVQDSQTRQQMAGLMIQGYMLKMRAGEEVRDDLVAFLDKMIAEKPDETFLVRLVSVKIQILSMMVQEDPSKADVLAQALSDAPEVPGINNLLSVGWAGVYVARVKNIAAEKGSIDDLNAVLDQIKAKISDTPILALTLSDLQPQFEAIGAANGDPELLSKVYGDFIEICEKSDNEMLQGAAKILTNALQLTKIVGTEIAFKGIEVAPEADKQFDSETLKGKYFLVDQWTTKDQGCFEQIEEVKQLHADFSAKGFEVVGINTSDETELLTRVLEVFEMPWIILSGKQAEEQGILLPETLSALPPGKRVLVGPDAKVLLVTDDLQQVRELLAEKLGAAEAADAQAEESK